MTLHPQFINNIGQLFPGEEARRLLDAITSTEAVTSIRVNAVKTALRPLGDRVPWCETGYYLSGHEPFTFDPFFHAGLYYVQDASSMIIDHIVRTLIDRPVRYLDLCAAPGGKTTAALSALPQGSLMVCNEVVPQRANILKENVMKWGNPACVVASDDSSRWGKLTHFFDVVAADVPCSGEGMFRKDAEAVTQWSPGLVEQCAGRQRLIIDNVWNALAPGGLFIYSTCTYNRDEDEAMVEYMVSQYGAEHVSLDMPREWNIACGAGGEDYCYRFLPHRTRGEGLFVCVLRKPDDEVRASLSVSDKRRNTRQAAAVKVPECVKQWLACATGYSFTVNGDTVSAVPEVSARDMDVIASQVKVLSRGVETGNIKGKDVVPAHSLALSTALNNDAFREVEIEYNDAIAYLRGDAVSLGDVPRGMVLLRYRGVPIGFAKQIGNRANNLYPREWRIRSTHAPAVPPEILKCVL